MGKSARVSRKEHGQFFCVADVGVLEVSRSSARWTASASESGVVALVPLQCFPHQLMGDPFQTSSGWARSSHKQ